MKVEVGAESTTLSSSATDANRHVLVSVDSKYSEVCKKALTLTNNNNNNDFEKIDCEEKEKNEQEVVYSNNFLIICNDSKLFNCMKIQDSYFSNNSHVENCTLTNTTVLTTLKISNCFIKKSIISQHCAVDAQASVENSFLFEHSSITKKAVVQHCILGVDTSVAIGECYHSLLGSNIGFHHQSLLISTMWPLGRGNIGYGAMIGCNHTGRKNDQECFLGFVCFHCDLLLNIAVILDIIIVIININNKI
jgi:NDP-sugar pyrophosphorylase family protein